jgi:hypothetical protein
MTTASLASDNSLTGGNDDHLEIFSLIWLDANVHVGGNQDIQQRMRLIINHVKIFQDGDKCKQYIEQRPKHDRLVLIANRELARQVVPSIHQLRQVSAIYISSTDKQSDEEWAHEFVKVVLLCQASVVLYRWFR